MSDVPRTTALRANRSRFTVLFTTPAACALALSLALGVLQEASHALPSPWLMDITIPRAPVFAAASEAGVPLGLLDKSVAPAVAWTFEMLAASQTERLGLSAPVKIEHVPLI